METHCQVGLLEHADRHQKARACAVMAAPSETYIVSHSVLFVVCCKGLTYLVYFNVRHGFCR
jgi:hypothetical protein